MELELELECYIDVLADRLCLLYLDLMSRILAVAGEDLRILKLFFN